MFDENSFKRLRECDERLEAVFMHVEKKWPCTVICGYRGKEEQDKAFDGGFSKVKFPGSPHNKEPKSQAADVIPFPPGQVNWKDIDRFKRFGYFVLGVAHGMGIKIKWGADWNMDLNISDESFIDYPHYEIVKV